MSRDDFPILPATKVAAPLERYPHLEDILVSLAPPFRKLKNPLLRKGVARVASLKQAAAVAGISVEDLVNTLRAAVGQDPVGSEGANPAAAYFSAQPDWFSASKIVKSIDERIAGEDTMPIVVVLREASRLQPEEILELVTNFLPAPGIDIMKKKGLRVWSVQEEVKLVRTYISKPTARQKDASPGERGS